MKIFSTLSLSVAILQWVFAASKENVLQVLVGLSLKPKSHLLCVNTVNALLRFGSRGIRVFQDKSLQSSLDRSVMSLRSSMDRSFIFRILVYTISTQKLLCTMVLRILVLTLNH